MEEQVHLDTQLEFPPPRMLVGSLTETSPFLPLSLKEFFLAQELIDTLQIGCQQIPHGCISLILTAVSLSDGIATQ